MNLSFRTLDVTSAFLYAELPTDVTIFARIPEGHPDYALRSTHVLRIKKNLYGLKEAPKLWWFYLRDTLVNRLHLTQGIYDECLFTNKNTILLAYVDDMLLLGKKTHINQ